MQRPYKEQIVLEHSTVRLEEGLCQEDISYLRSSLYGREGKKPFIVRELKNNEIEIENTSFAGVIQLKKVRLIFTTKTTANLFFMLNSLRDEQSMFFDDERIIDMERGGCFFDVIGRLFLNELGKILTKGFCKRYVRKEEREAFIRGRLLIDEQIKQGARKEIKSHCRFDDLTYDNLENQLILRATSLLIPMIRFCDPIRRDLVRYSNLLREEVSLLTLGPGDCEKVNLNRTNDYYGMALKLTKAVLKRYFIRTTNSGISSGFNFIVNMNKLYEDFVTEMLREMLKESPMFCNYSIEVQKTFDSLVKERTILTRPDIIMRERVRAKNLPIIIDAKYKRQEHNTDFYQVIAYALAIPTSKAAILIYPKDETDGIVEPTVYTIAASKFNNMRDDIKLYILRIDLMQKKYDRLEEFKKAIKHQLQEQLISVLNPILNEI